MCDNKGRKISAGPLNNLSGNSNFPTADSSGSSSSQVLSIHNLLSSDKENVCTSSQQVEKNLRRSLDKMEHQTLRSALRQTQNSIAETAEMTQQKVSKQIRFNLQQQQQNSFNSSVETTPPPREFKRMGNQRKTLRPFSALVTESELRSVYDSCAAAAAEPETPPNQLHPHVITLRSSLTPISVDSPRAPQGFVKSMCQLFGSSSSAKSQLNRSNSFSVRQKTESTTGSLLSGQLRSSFRLFRSNSWSSRNKNKTVKIADSETQSSQQTVTVSTEQRCSPSSYSTKSQDSGFSENNNAAETNAVQRQVKMRSSSTSQLRLQFLRASMELSEDSADPNLTQLPNLNSNPVQCNSQQNHHQPGEASHKVAESLSNIASMQTGLSLKRTLAEEALEVPSNGALNLLRPNDAQQNLTSEKIRPKSFLVRIKCQLEIVLFRPNFGKVFVAHI